MVGQIATKSAQNNFNINQMSNGAKGEMAYTMVDFLRRTNQSTIKWFTIH